MTLRTIFAGILLAITPAAIAAPPVEGSYVLPDRPVWAGEVFELGLQWRVDRESFRALSGELVWGVEPLATEAWDKPVLTDLRSPATSIITFKRTAMASQSGRVDLPPASLGFLMQTGSVSNGDYTRAILEPIQARSQSATLVVRPLPAAPSGFRGAVGQFQLTASLDRAQVETGELVTWTLSLSGRGNWPMLAALPTRALPSGLQLRDTEREDVKVDGEFERTRRESLSFVVAEPGTYRLPSVELPIFDPISGRYVTVESPEVALVASGVSANAMEFTDELLDDNIDVIKPLSGSLRAIAPLSADRVERWPLLGALGVALLWVSLACLRAWLLDPERRVRAAHRRLRHLMPRLARIDAGIPLSAASVLELRRWQLAVAERWRVSGCAPTAVDFLGRDPWYALWVESDAALYGPAARLSPDWTSRASHAVASVTAPPPFELRSVLRRECWWPRFLPLLMAIVSCGLLPSQLLQAKTAIERGIEQVQQEPLDVIARYNLAIALEADGRLSEAAVHSGIAWLQEPRFEQGAELWIRLRSQAGLLSASNGGLPESAGAVGRVRSALPPGVWQRLYLLALFSVVSLAALLLACAYWQRLRPALRATTFGLVIALAGGVVTFLVTSSYAGSLDPAAVVVHQQSTLREIPVENRLDEGNWVLPGAVGIVERRFLGWVRLQLSDGRRGWLRDEAIIALWGQE